jgi:gliding motility-associated-like protein
MNGIHSIIAKDHDRHGYFESIYFNHNDKFRTFAGYDFNGLVNDSHAINEYSIGDWIHIAYVYSDSSSSLYINGMIDSTSNAVANFDISNQHDLYFGKFSDYWYPFNGALDEVRIYNRALSAEEVACLYNGDCSSLILSAKITENQFCKGGNTSLQLFNAQPGIKYQVFKGESEVGNFQIGNSDTLTFPIDGLYETSSFTVLATDTITGCSVILDSTFVVDVNDVEAIALAEMPTGYIPVAVIVSSQSVSAETYEWFLDGVKFAGTAQSQVVIDSTGTHTIVLLVNTGPPDYCTDTDTLYLTTTERTEVFLEIPSSFTPNTDGINDYFEFFTEGIDSYTVWLKDSWGVLVYEYDKFTGKWDGLTNAGKEAPAGPYYYHIAAYDYTGMALERSGVVYLIRDLIELSPIPVKDNLVIRMNGRLPGERTIRVMSIYGQVISELSSSGDLFEIDVSGLASGTFFLRISNQKDVLNVKFIKE